MQTAQTAPGLLHPLPQAGWAVGLLGFNVNNIFAKKHGGKKRGPLADDASEHRMHWPAAAAPLPSDFSTPAAEQQWNALHCLLCALLWPWRACALVAGTEARGVMLPPVPCSQPAAGGERVRRRNGDERRARPGPGRSGERHLQPLLPANCALGPD